MKTHPVNVEFSNSWTETMQMFPLKTTSTVANIYRNCSRLQLRTRARRSDTEQKFSHRICC